MKTQQIFKKNRQQLIAVKEKIYYNLKTKTKKDQKRKKIKEDSINQKYSNKWKNKNCKK